MKSIPLVLFSCLSLALLDSRSSTAAENKADLAKKAKAILLTNCYACHGRNGANEGSFNFVLDREQLVRSKKVIPGQPRKSRLFQKVSLDEMPPDTVKAPRPSDKDVTTLRQWIEAGAPDFNPPPEKREFISRAEQLRSIKADLDRLPRRKRRSARYFTITHLYNAGLNEDQLQSYRHALSKLVNSLSWGRDIVPPRPVDPARTVFRIELDDYEWNDKVWDRIVEVYPYGVLDDSPLARSCAAATQSRMPHVRGDWFVHAASRPPLYHDVLQLPATDRELEKELKVDVAENIRRERVARAGFNGSGVSQNNRLIERHKSGNGAYWKSYDFASNKGKRNLFAHPLGPRGSNAFRHDGGEIIFNLPNGLQAYLLVDGKGNRIDQGPTDIVSTRKRPPTVINGISCMECHGKGMIDKVDQVREHVQNSAEGFTEAEKESILALYPAPKEFLALLRRDAERFRKAVARTGAPLTATEPVAALADRYEAEIDLPMAAAEAGVGVREFARSLRSRRLARDLGNLQVAGGTVKREVFREAFPEVVRALQLGQWLPRRALPKVLINSIGMKLVPIPAGEFLMGSPDGDDEARDSEKPQHRVRITRPFYLGAFEVTQEQYRRVMNKKPSYFNAKRLGKDTRNYPVDSVSWESAVEFCRKLSQLPAEKRAGRVYRLPTEAEWEYACRAGTRTRYHSGDSLEELKKYRDFVGGKVPEINRPVGEFLPNPFGLYDMHGNVREWVADWYGRYPAEDQVDPKGPSRGTRRIVRGGCYHFWVKDSRSASRFGVTSTPARNIGFRVALIP
jgi:formylglycine-generating enzyme required for sulfatase activity/mono/diheme cytochrome c family protein